MGVVRAAVHIRPVLPYLLRVLQHARMLQDAAGLRAVAKEAAAVFLHSQRGAEAVLHHGDGREAYQTVEAKPWDMENLIRPEEDVLVPLARLLVGVCVVDVVDAAVLVPVDLHVLRQQRVQRHDAVPAVPDDLGVCVAVQEQVRHQRLEEGEARHLRVRLAVQQLIQRMLRGADLVAPGGVGVFVEVQREPRHRLCQQTDTGVNRGNLHGGFLVDGFAGVSLAENEGLPGIADAVFDLGRVPGADAQPFKESHIVIPPIRKREDRGYRTRFPRCRCRSGWRGQDP